MSPPVVVLIGAETPDSLLSGFFETGREDLIFVLRQARVSLKKPPVSSFEYLEALRRQGLARTCALHEPFLSDL